MAKDTQPNTAEPTTKTMTIEGLSFEINCPYAEGGVMTAAEAKVLNQVRGENIANNLRKSIKSMRGEDGEFPEEALAQIATMVAEKDAEYVFTLAAASSVKSRDPIQVEAMRLAREYVNGQIKAQLSMTVKAFKEAKGDDNYNEKVAEVAENEKIIELARARVAERESLKTIEL